MNTKRSKLVLISSNITEEDKRMYDEMKAAGKDYTFRALLHREIKRLYRLFAKETAGGKAD